VKTLSFAFSALRRELRSGELLVLAAALTIAVTSLTAIGFLTDRIAQAVSLQAAEVLAADIRLRSAQPMDPAPLEAARAGGLSTAETLTFPSVVFAGDSSALATIKAVGPGYPLRGRVRVADEVFGAERVADGLPPPGSVWADSALLGRIGARVGDRLEVGSSTLRIDAVLTYRPDQTPGFSGLAPSLLMNLDEVPATGLVQTGSRVSHAQLYAGDRDLIAGFVQAWEDRLPETVRLEDRGDAGEELNAAVDRAGRFLALASLVSLLLSAVAVAMSARRYAERRLDTAALMKSLGASQSFIFGISLLQLAMIGILAGLAGAGLGFVAEAGLSRLLSGLIGGDLPPPSATPVMLGLGTSLILLLGFALPSLMRLRSTPPLRVLRRDLSPPPPGAWLTTAAALVALSAMVYWAVRDVALLVLVLGGTAVIAAVLYVAGRLLVLALSRLRGRVGVAWRYGLANVARRGSDSAVQVVAFGLGLMVLLLLTLVRNDLLAGWRATLDETAPNHFLINIQPEDRDSVAAILTRAGVAAPEFVPLVRARLTAINGVPIGGIAFEDERGRGMAEREQNLSFAAELSASNRVVAGAWWPSSYDGPPLVSMEADAARELGVDLGDELAYLVAGEPLGAEVASIREVQWDSFEPNFFMVLSPGALEGYPRTYISSFFIDPERKGALLELVRRHPSISVIDIQALIAQVRGVIDKAALAVQYVFLFTLLAGLVVLFAAVQSTLDERRYESALLRTFGARRRTVTAGLASEFLALGLLAGVFAAAGATVLGMLAARRLFDLDYTFDPTLWLVGMLAGMLLVGVSGTLAARGAVNAPPVNTLRRV
jgi:putative ABC transport system permease protein